MIQWLTTRPSGRAHTHGADDGQTGWRLHAVVANSEATFEQIKHYRAACGMRPRHGWGLDLFIERRCARCEKKLGLEPCADNRAAQQFKEDR